MSLGKNIKPETAVIIEKFWKQKILPLDSNIKQKMNLQIINQTGIKLSDSSTSKTFPFIQHLDLLFSSLLRIDIDLEDVLRESWGNLHFSLNINAEHCEIALNEINHLFKAHFGRNIYSVGIEFLFSKIYRLSVNMMFNCNKEGFLNKIVELKESDKQIISQSLQHCLNHQIGKTVMYSYLKNKKPSIYLFLCLVNDYIESPQNSTIDDILNTSIKTEIEMFLIDISDESRNEFIKISSIPNNHDNVKNLLNKMKKQQIDIVNKLYWKTFQLFLF